MFLSDRESKIVAACENEADLTTAEIAARTNLAAHTVRYALTSLESRGILTQRAFIDSFRLGADLHLVFLRFLPEKIGARAKVVKHLASLPETSFISDLSGSFNLAVELRTRSALHLYAILEELSSKVGNVFQQNDLIQQLALYEFPTVRRGASSGTKVFHISAVEHTPNLDELDSRILTLLAKQWPKSHNHLAKSLGVPASTIEYRIQRLQTESYLLGSCYWVNVRALGGSEYFHLIRARGVSSKLRSRLVSFAWKESCVSTLRATMGAWDSVLECYYQDAQESLAFNERLLQSHAGEISLVESISVLDFLKISDCTVLSAK